MANERMLDKTTQPTLSDMGEVIGKPLDQAWLELNHFVQTTYQVEPVIHFGGAKYGWQVDYRRGGRPLCSIFPEHGSFTTLIVLGGKEAAQALARLDSFRPLVRACLENTPAFHDGRWLWIRIADVEDVADLEQLLLMKRRPVKKTA
jgi:hypothetical protein